jgi:hypothetical protein
VTDDKARLMRKDALARNVGPPSVGRAQALSAIVSGLIQRGPKALWPDGGARLDGVAVPSWARPSALNLLLHFDGARFMIAYDKIACSLTSCLPSEILAGNSCLGVR